MRVFDITFNYKLDSPPGKDPDSHSPLLKADHQLLWTKELSDGDLFEVQVPADPKERRKNYLMFEQTPDTRFTFGSDAITNSYTKWGKPRNLVEAKAELSEEQQRRARSAEGIPAEYLRRNSCVLAFAWLCVDVAWPRVPAPFRRRPLQGAGEPACCRTYTTKSSA